MEVLRWLLLAGAVVAGIGFGALVFVGMKFREGFGASPLGSLWALVPPVAGVVLVLSLRAGASRQMLHGTAVMVVLLMVLCGWEIYADSAVDLVVAEGYLGLWLVYYGMAVRGQV